MFLKEIILEGFKSYSTKTRISGFDRHFNAITGLNGSGKSNILDAICFVLGISNISVLRASMLQDLIYKSGTAGITTASVSLVFDNRDGNECPVNYEDVDEIIVTRQISVTGKSKYTINNCAAQAKRVIDLFCSVQLDVNNPHFLIMQGQITKVLNMKPKEILGLVENTVGTSTYDVKRNDVLKLIEKKDITLTEIGSILSDEIGPAIERLKSQKTSYAELKRIEKEIQSLEKYRVIFIYRQHRVEIDTLRFDLSKLDACYEDLKGQKAQANNELMACKKEEKCSDRESEITTVKDKLKEANDNALGLLKEKARLSSDLKHSQNILRDHCVSIKQINAQIDQAKLEVLRDEDKEKELQVKISENPISHIDKNIEAIRRKIADVAADIIIDETNGQAISKNELILKLKATHTEKESLLIKFQTQFEKAKTERDIIYRQVNSDSRKQASQIEKELAALLETLNSDINIDNNFEHIETEYRTLNSKYELLNSKLAADSYYFHYDDPCPQFDRKRVLGRLGCLFKIKDHTKFGKAIEAAIGVGRLLNIVVDSVDTAKLLLAKCSFKQRVTIIPLNGVKIPKDVHYIDDIEQKANQLISSNKGQRVWSALSLIECENRVKPCIEFALNTKLICTDLDTAKLVAFHPSLNGKVAVTLDGDVFDPAGVLTGGSSKNAQSCKLLVTQLSEMCTLQEELISVKRDLDTCNTQRLKLAEQRKQLQVHRQRKCELERKLAMTGVIELRKAESSLEQITNALSDAQKDVDHLSDRLCKLKTNTDINDEDKADKMLNQLLASRKEMERIEQRIEAMKLEISDRHKEIKALTNQLDEAKIKETELIVIESQQSKEMKKLEAQICQNDDELAEIKQQLAELIQSQRSADDHVEQLKATISSLEVEIKSVQSDLRNTKDRLSQCQAKFDDLIEKHPWVESYDTSESSENVFSQEELERLKKLRTNLRRTVNTQAVDMLGEKEEQYHELLRKEKIVKGNKVKIQSIIVEWDELKRLILNKAWRSVSRDFGQIFSTLLPGASAKLELSRSINKVSNDVVDCGLDIHVGFGGQWKESLVELSGGQRSLAAMSLILALLRYKPAPIYIMDEIDAALDMSHTQNMGIMIQTFFHQSQFIIVSLKDGMFKNANVLFKTMLKDGISSISKFKND